ncbi:MAG: hypothetical protein ACI8WB_004007 [Phenylobacterium sp.]|jgi:hypothetical protein
MARRSPSYGVFMVDIFASSVGIFILVSLLYIIVSAKATSNEAMVERFKTLIKRDEVPIHNYFIPAQNNPLHDWGIRATYARETKQALILLLRDQVLLYHTGERLSISEFIDSDKVRQYYAQYQQQQRLFLEVHYNDAYHALNAKIRQALPENVRTWTHWAYNAGNLTNPNPTQGQYQGEGNGRGAKPGERPTTGGGDGPGDNTSGSNTLGDNGLAENGPGAGGGQQTSGAGNGQAGTDNGQQPSGSGGDPTDMANASPGADSDELTIGREGVSDGLLTPPTNGANADNAAGSALDGKPGGTSWPRKNLKQKATSKRDSAEAQRKSDAIQKQVTEQLNRHRDEQQFIKRFLAPARSDRVPKPQDQTEKPELNVEQKNLKTKPKKRLNDGQSPADEGKKRRSGKSPNQPGDENSQTESQRQGQQTTPEAEEASKHIQKNVYLAIPMYSPIYQFMLDVQVPGYQSERYYLDGVGFKLLPSPSSDSTAGFEVKLIRGDYIMPIDATLTTPLTTPSTATATTPAWHQVKIMKVQQTDQPQTGWLFGYRLGEVFMMPVYQNAIHAQTDTGTKYRFKPSVSDDLLSPKTLTPKGDE